MDDFIPLIMSAVMIFAGLFGIVRPVVMWEWEEKPANDQIQPTALALRKVRFTCAILLTLGLIALAFCLFAEPAIDPALI